MSNRYSPYSITKAQRKAIDKFLKSVEPPLKKDSRIEIIKRRAKQ